MNKVSAIDILAHFVDCLWTRVTRVDCCCNSNTELTHKSKCDCDLDNIYFVLAHRRIGKKSRAAIYCNAMIFLLSFIFGLGDTYHSLPFSMLQHCQLGLHFDLGENVDANVYRLTVAFGALIH